MKWLRYHWWMLDCSRAEWCGRVLDAYEAGYRDMFTYWDEKIRSKR